MLKRILSMTSLLFAFVLIIQAQNLRLSGRLTNAATQQPMEFATVVLQTSDSAFVNGTTSNLSGNFVIENISSGDYQLVTTSIGFDTVRVELLGFNKSIDVGNISMSENATHLSEVVVDGTAIINKSDRKLYFVNENQRSGASNGMNLVSKLNIPRLTFNPLQNSITSIDNKNIEFRINDIPSQKEDILALQPKDIVRVEFIDNPGLKYGADAGYVLNYICRNDNRADRQASTWGTL